MIRRAINHHFCLSCADRQRASPFQTRTQMIVRAIRRGLMPAQVARMLISSIIEPLYYNAHMKIMAIDYGEKRVGIASTDESGEFALPRMTLPNDESLLEAIIKFKKEEGIEEVVLGESKNFQGEANPLMQKVNQLKIELENLGIKVAYHPELWTTVEARRLQGQTDLTDASAAALILKSYIERKKGSV